MLVEPHFLPNPAFYLAYLTLAKSLYSRHEIVAIGGQGARGFPDKDAN